MSSRPESVAAASRPLAVARIRSWSLRMSPSSVVCSGPSCTSVTVTCAPVMNTGIRVQGSRIKSYDPRNVSKAPKAPYTGHSTRLRVIGLDAVRIC